MTPDPAHIDAVARTMTGGGEPCEGSLSDAECVLTSKRPEVHAAMLDALTRYGVLTEKWRWVEPFEPSDPKRRHRLVTPWEVAP